MSIYIPPNASWAQLPNEPTEMYARFLFHVTQGPSRNLAKTADAWKAKFGYKTRHKNNGVGTRNALTGDWDRWSSEWQWRERSARFDVYMIQQVIPEIAGIIFECVKLYALKVYEVLSDPEIKPEDWSTASEALQTLTGFISPESIASASLHHSGNSGTDSKQLTEPNDSSSSDATGNGS